MRKNYKIIIAAIVLLIAAITAFVYQSSKKHTVSSNQVVDVIIEDETKPVIEGVSTFPNTDSENGITSENENFLVNEDAGAEPDVDAITETEDLTETIEAEEITTEDNQQVVINDNSGIYDYASVVPVYSGNAYVIINGNQPYFTDEELTTVPFENYSELDDLGRCGAAYANICIELMPTEERGEIGMVKPSGWQTVKYDFVDGKYLYNRCHLIGFQLAGENTNVQNLITGTRYLNVTGMLPFENQVANYVKNTDNHVLYRVTPLFIGDNLLAYGVWIEAKSVEDHGEGICFNVFCYNVQPGVSIDYATGMSEEDGTVIVQASATPAIEQTQQSTTEITVPVTPAAEDITYVCNTNTMRFHYPNCSSVSQMAEHNRMDVTWTREECINEGYQSCGRCHP